MSDQGGTVITGEANIRAAAAIARVGALANGAISAGRVAQMIGSTHRVRKAVMEDYVIWLYEQGITLGAAWGTVERCLENPNRYGRLRRKCEKMPRR